MCFDENPCAKLCGPDIIKNINIKQFNLMSRINKKKTNNMA